MKHSLPTLYLFNNVIYPLTIIPLTVNDAVSKNVLLQCYEKETSLVFYHPSLRAKKIATTGKIILLEHNPDGSMSALIQGLTRVELIAQEQHLPYPIYLIQDYVDTIISTPVIMNDTLEKLQSILVSWLQRHISSVKERDRFIKEMNSPVRLINNLSMLLIKDVDLKVILLENTSLPDRVRLLEALLKGSSPEIEDSNISEAIKNFQSLEPLQDVKDAI
jgi:ATP-dependent Lon protease